MTNFEHFLSNYPTEVARLRLLDRILNAAKDNTELPNVHLGSLVLAGAACSTTEELQEVYGFFSGTQGVIHRFWGDSDRAETDALPVIALGYEDAEPFNGVRSIGGYITPLHRSFFGIAARGVITAQEANLGVAPDSGAISLGHDMYTTGGVVRVDTIRTQTVPDSRISSFSLGMMVLGAEAIELGVNVGEIAEANKTNFIFPSS